MRRTTMFSTDAICLAVAEIQNSPPRNGAALYFNFYPRTGYGLAWTEPTLVKGAAYRIRVKFKWRPTA